MHIQEFYDDALKWNCVPHNWLVDIPHKAPVMRGFDILFVVNNDSLVVFIRPKLSLTVFDWGYNEVWEKGYWKIIFP